MKLTFKFLSLMMLTSVVLLMMGCSVVPADGDICSGGSSTDCSGRTVSSVLIDPFEKKPVAGAVVIMRSRDYVPNQTNHSGLNKRSSNNSTNPYITITDKDGRFQFDSVVYGKYSIVGSNKDRNLFVFIDPVNVDSTRPDMINLDTSTLKPPSTITGKIGWMDSSMQQVFVAVMGTDKIAEVNSDGSFVLDLLPEGNLRLRFLSVKNSVIPIKMDSINVDAPAGDTINVDSILSVPEITILPASPIKINTNENCTLSIKTNNAAGCSYIWYKDAKVHDTTDTGLFIITNATKEDAGTYVCVVVNKWGADTSSDIILKVVPLFTFTSQKQYGGTGEESGRCIQQTNDGGFIIAGETNSFGAGGYDIYLIKTNASEDTTWTKTFGGTNDEHSSFVQQTRDGGYIITGYTASFGAGNYDVYLIKTTAVGDTLWTKTFGGFAEDVAYSAQQTSDDGYIILGLTECFGAVNHDFYLIKTTATGDTVWTKRFGGTGTEYGYSVRQTSDGGYILTGYTSSFGAGNADVYLIKTTATGDTLWTKTFGGTNVDYGISLQQTSDGGYIITGNTESFGAGGKDVYLIKTDAAGDTTWTKTFGGTGTESGQSVCQTSDGGYIVTGFTESFGSGDRDVYLIKTTANGDSVWTKTFGGTNRESGNSVLQTSDGGYSITGETYSFGTGSSDVYLIKTDANGNTNN